MVLAGDLVWAMVPEAEEMVLGLARIVAVVGTTVVALARASGKAKNGR